MASTRRIVEVAIIVAQRSGEILSRYETIINPRETVGHSVQIHGLSDGVLKGAPTFDEVAAEVWALVEGRTFVAHNLPFDWSSLASEFRRLGIVIGPPSGWCTSRLAARAMGRNQRDARVRLGDACAHFGVANHAPHTAAGDADAAFELLRAIETLRPLPPTSAVPRCPKAWALPASTSAPLARKEVQL